MNTGDNLKHDEYFRKSLSNLVIAQEFLDNYLLEDIKEIINARRYQRDNKYF